MKKKKNMKDLIQEILNEGTESKKGRPGKAMSVHHLHDATEDEVPTIEPAYGKHSKGKKAGTTVNPEIKKN